MARPRSIVRYERLYLASVALGLISYSINWQAMVGMLAQNPTLAGQTWLLWLRALIGLAISLTLWHFTARVPRIVAKWIVAIFAAFTTLGLVFSLVQLARGHAIFGVSFLMTIVVDAVYMVAAILLFRRDAAAWFGETPLGAEPVS